MVTKYSVYGGYTKASLPADIPTRLVRCLVEAANMSLSKNTWRSYNTAKRHIARYTRGVRRDMVTYLHITQLRGSYEGQVKFSYGSKRCTDLYWIPPGCQEGQGNNDREIPFWPQVAKLYYHSGNTYCEKPLSILSSQRTFV